MHKAIETTDAPAAIGPYVQARVAGGMVFCSGQLGMDPATGALADGVQAQTLQALANLCAVLKAAGCGASDVIKTTIFLADMEDFAEVNAIYAQTFGDNPPARACVEVSRLPKDGRIEIECIALLP